MTLRKPAAHPRRAPGWRRSGDESHWGSFTSEEEPRSSPFSRAPRPQSAIEGGQLDVWLEHLRAMQSKVRSPNQNPPFDDRTASTPALEGQPAGRVWRQTGYSSFSTASSSRGSSPSSQESLQTVWLPSPERSGGWEKAHIMQSPSKEQAQLSYLAPVRTGWLPIQRRVMTAGNTCSQNQHLHASAGQVKLKQPITPAFQKTDPYCYKAEAERSPTSPSAQGVKTRKTPDQDSAVIHEGPEIQNSASKEVNRSVGWRALRTGWKPNRASDPPGGNTSSKLGRGTDLEPNEKPYLMTTASTEPAVHSPLHRTASSDPTGRHISQQGLNAANTHKYHSPLQRTSSVQPLKATVFYGTNNKAESSHIQTSSPVTTLIPQNKAGLSSITISSRKVSRSASLPSSRSNKSSLSPPDLHPMDPNSRQVRVQRKATIVKVTEQRVISSSAQSTSRPGTPPSGNALDTVVRRRKATIIKVTEHKESYSPGKITPRNPEYRHSYTEGLFKNNNTANQEDHLDNSKVPAYHLNSSQSAATAPNPSSSNTKKNETLHRSTLNFFISNLPAIASSPSEPPPRAPARRSERPQRPLSCYGSLIGNFDQSKESVAQSSGRKGSSGLPREAPDIHAQFNRLFISSEKAVKESATEGADALTPSRDEKERLPPTVDGTRRASPSLTLIKAPDPDSHQSQEEVLALNAAAIIANIKLQRQLSKKTKTPSGDSERDSTASPQGNAVTDKRKHINSEKSGARHRKQPHVEFIPLLPDQERSSESASLQRALERSKPEFISRSQERVRVLERKVQERRERSGAGKLEWRGDQLSQLRAHSSTGSTSVNGNLCRPTDRGISPRDVQPRSQR